MPSTTSLACWSSCSGLVPLFSIPTPHPCLYSVALRQFLSITFSHTSLMSMLFLPIGQGGVSPFIPWVGSLCAHGVFSDRGTHLWAFSLVLSHIPFPSYLRELLSSAKWPGSFHFL